MKKSWLDKHQDKIIFFTWCFIILTCLLVIFTSPVKAATNPDYDLPLTIGIPERLADDTGIDSNIVNQAIQGYLDILLNQYSFDGSDDYTVFISGRDDKDLVIVVTYNLTCGHIPENDPNFSTDYENIFYNNISQHYVQFLYDGDTGTLGSGNFYGGWVSTWSFNRANLNYGIGWVLASVNEIPDYWVFGSSTPVVNTGHATQPINDPDNIIKDDNNNPIQRPTRPTPSIFNPQPWTPPTIDTSSLEELVESLIDVVKYGFSYLGDLISGTFSNLLSNLGAWVDYIVQSFNYGFNNVVKAIQNLATDFYNNMVSLFEPLYLFFSGVASFFNHLIEIGTVDGAFNLANIVTYLFIPDSATLYPIFVSHDEFNIIGISNHLFDEYRTMLSSVENINSLHYIMIPSFTFHGVAIPQTRIDFSWFENYKVYTDGIISAFLIVGYVYFLFTRISGWLRGNQGDIYIGDNSSNYHGTKIGF